MVVPGVGDIVISTLMFGDGLVYITLSGTFLFSVFVCVWAGRTAGKFCAPQFFSSCSCFFFSSFSVFPSFFHTST